MKEKLVELNGKSEQREPEKEEKIQKSDFLMDKKLPFAGERCWGLGEKNEIWIKSGKCVELWSQKLFNIVPKQSLSAEATVKFISIAF